MAIMGDLFGAGGIATLAGKIVDVVKARIPDVNEHAKAQAELEKILAEHDFQIQEGQVEINKIEAASPHWFVAAARPMTLWICNGALFFIYIPKAIVMTSFWCYQAWATIHHGGSSLPPFPDLGAYDVIGLMGSLLGISVLRTREKEKGVVTTGMRR